MWLVVISRVPRNLWTLNVWSSTSFSSLSLSFTSPSCLLARLSLERLCSSANPELVLLLVLELVVELERLKLLALAPVPPLFTGILYIL